MAVRNRGEQLTNGGDNSAMKRVPGSVACMDDGKRREERNTLKWGLGAYDEMWFLPE